MIRSFDMRATVENMDSQKQKGVCSNCNRMVEAGASECSHCGKKFSKYNEPSLKLDAGEQSSIMGM